MKFLSITALVGLFSTITAQPMPSDRLVDVGIIVDVSSSFADDLARFRNESTAIVTLIQDTYPNALFGLATFQDYPFAPWGSATDQPHRLVQNLGPRAPFIAAVNNISASGGNDVPESQLVSLYQSITGVGQVVASGVAVNYTIAPQQNFMFRKGSARIILLWTDARFHTPNTTVGYPGPTLAQVVSAANGLGSRRRRLRDSRSLAPLGSDAVRVIGIVSNVPPASLPQLAELANATGAVAGTNGIDCDGNGSIDIVAGQPIVCPVGTGLTSVIVKVVQGIVPEIPKATAAPTKAPVLAPALAPVLAPVAAPTVQSSKCGLFQLRILCLNGCGLIGRIIGLCKN